MPTPRSAVPIAMLFSAPPSPLVAQGTPLMIDTARSRRGSSTSTRHESTTSVRVTRVKARRTRPARLWDEI